MTKSTSNTDVTVAGLAVARVLADLGDPDAMIRATTVAFTEVNRLLDERDRLAAETGGDPER